LKANIIKISIFVKLDLHRVSQLIEQKKQKISCNCYQE